MPLTFRADLGFDQVRLLDENRAADGTLSLSATFRFLISGSQGVEAAADSFNLPLSDENWRTVLGKMKYEERATFDVPVMGGQVGPPFDEAARFFRDAISQRDLRHHPQAVGAAREVFDALERTGVPLPAAPPRAEWKDQKPREAWDIEKRVSFIREAVDHATNAGHHRGIGDPNSKQSRLLVAMTGLLLKYYSEP